VGKINLALQNNPPKKTHKRMFGFTFVDMMMIVPIKKFDEAMTCSRKVHFDDLAATFTSSKLRLGKSVKN
jgi:phosphatidylglycerophosphatase A